MKEMLFTPVRATVRHVPLPSRMRDILMWPITTRLLGKGHLRTLKRDGYRIRVGLGDQLERMLLFYGELYGAVWEPETMRLLKRFAPHCRTVVTAGSHIGFVNLEILSALPGDAVIRTFEPSSALHARTLDNIRLNGAEDRMSVTRAALGEEEGIAELYVSDIRTSLIPYSRYHREEAPTETVHVTTLDAWRDASEDGPVGLLVLDVEGYELPAMRGAERLIREDRPVICFEVAEKIRQGKEAEATYAHLRSAGYDLFAVDDDYRLERVGYLKGRALLLDPERYEGGAYFNVFAVPDGHPMLEEMRTMRKDP